MSIKEDSKNKLVYEPLTQRELKKQRKELLETFKVFIEDIDSLDEIKVEINQYALGEVLTRTDKRKDYFKVFHETERINGVKEAAFRAYWILKFRPFISVESSTSGLITENESCRLINEGFAMFLLFSAIQRECEKKGIEFRMSDGYISHLKYGFQYWDLNKEALVLIGETLSEILVR